MKNYISREDDFCHIFDYLSNEITEKLIRPFDGLEYNPEKKKHNEKTQELLTNLSALKSEFFQLIQSHNAQEIDNK